ncbi:Arylsulfatase [Anaerohalosphaera lusitana]|uniref:Arylsulfatase n=1 Tax=Anaerohalosphaera lusitana TaxID=1936003 RepID=A0A1U9NGC3_9BACT|nr:sulfatase-like hydrolase/transferase [Anaerohalosphaera lusitana]AQT66981.1 Arylsulfatase [Anaerohalosphaera lusitana]
MNAGRYNRRDFLKLAGFAAGAAVTGCTGAAQNAGSNGGKSGKPLNFVFILADDLGWKDLGVYGSEFYETPNIDRLASEGMLFTDGYAACPVCSPTRASIMAGKYPARMDTTDWFGAPQPHNVRGHWLKKPLLPAPYVPQLPLEEVTIPEALKQHGYKTFFAGKWHLGHEGFYPEDQGFDVNIGGYFRGGPYTGKRYFSPYDNPKMENGPEGEHLPIRLGKETAKFVTENKERPFLAYLSFYSVHTPLMTTEELKKKYQQKKKEMGLEAEWGKQGERRERLVQEHAVYAGMVEAMDTAVGIVLDELEEQGLAENTAVMFMSDNGGLSTSEGHPTSNVPLRAGKGWIYEGGIREPWIVKWPGVTKPGSTCDEPVISTDFYPTMLDMAGLPLMPEQHKDGVSIVPLLEGGDSLDREAIFWHYPHYGNQGGSPSAAVRAGEYKLIEWYEDDSVELYNLEKDISEEHDLSEKMPEKTAELRMMLHEWQEEVDAKMPKRNPNAAE